MFLAVFEILVIISLLGVILFLITQISKVLFKKGDKNENK